MSKGEKQPEKAEVVVEAPIEAPVENGITIEAEAQQNEPSEEDNDDIFITEKDVFEASVEFFHDKEGNIVVEGVSKEFDSPDNSSFKRRKLGMTFKYPSTGDCSIMGRAGLNGVGSTGEVSIRQMTELELNRLLILIRGWTLDRECNQINIFSLEPDLVDGILQKIRDKISLRGIF